jgi:pimeloyl-ACP methyl ester carboxylesterase
MAAMSADLRFAKHRLPSGLGLHVAEQGPEDGRAVLMLHGYSDSWVSYSRILPLLPVDWHVIVPDQRGHGDSARPMNGYAPADLARDAIQLMDLLGISEAALVGHSMGSFIARAVAAQAPQRVERLVLVGSAATARNAVTQDLLREVEALDDPVGEDFVRAFQASTIHRAVPAAFFEQIVAERLKLPAHVWKAALSRLLAADPALDLARIRCRVLILGGAGTASSRGGSRSTWPRASPARYSRSARRSAMIPSGRRRTMSRSICSRSSKARRLGR